MIKIDDKNLTITISLWQKSYDAIGAYTGDVPTIMGHIIRGNKIHPESEFWINYLIDLGYKDDQQLGMEIIRIDTKKELLDICKRVGTIIEETIRCDVCGKPIYGCWTYNKKGNVCSNCEYD